MTEREALKLALEALVLNNAEWKALADSGDAGFWEAEEQDHYKQTEQTITAIQEHLAQLEQEPVAEVDDWRDSIFTRYVEYLPSGTRLYTTLLEPKPMTDEEIDKMCPKFEDPMRREMWMIGFKAAHGIKEQL